MLMKKYAIISLFYRLDIYYYYYRKKKRIQSQRFSNWERRYSNLNYLALKFMHVKNMVCYNNYLSVKIKKNKIKKNMLHYIVLVNIKIWNNYEIWLNYCKF